MKTYKEKLVVVDKNDRVLRMENRAKCQEGKGILHRAFSVYLFNNKGQLLIQKRSKNKELWPLYWSNSCCSHTKKGESYVRAGERRLKQELGFSVPLTMIGKFTYQARYKDIGSENEICAILVGRYNGRIKKDPEEVGQWKWINPSKLDFRKGKYTPWFKKGFKEYLKIKKKREEEIESFLKKVSKKVDPVIEKLLESYIDKRFQKIANYQAFTGGKRLRPSLVLACSRLMKGREKDVVYPAAGLEILHNSTLIVDDIIDHSQLRRKKPTVWFKFGQSIAECMGLDYLAASFEGAGNSKKPEETTEIFSNALKTVINGEILDVLFEQSGRQDPFVKKNRFNKVSNRDYYAMIRRKTASLSQACCETAGVNSKASKEQIRLLKDYGLNLGLAFQVRDDILDIFGQRKVLGKKIGKDIEEQKLGNIVILLALKELKGKNRQKLLKIIRKKGMINDKDIEQAVRLIKKTKSREEAGKIAEQFAEKAKQALKKLPQNKWNSLLENLVDFVVQRNK